MNVHVSSDICYLCGKNLAVPISQDHVPPRQFFARTLRQTPNPSNLLTLRVHTSCNKAYQHDEDYFVHTLMPFARGSYAGNAIYNEVLAKFKRNEKVGLTKKVLKEFERRPSGIVLPRNGVLKRFEGARLQRIAWKIVRGLYFDHHKIVLPADHTTWVYLSVPGQIPPPHFMEFMKLPNNMSYGRYTGVFEYRFQHFFETSANLHYWALLLWDRIIVIVIFHDPTCSCSRCRVRNDAAT